MNVPPKNLNLTKKGILNMFVNTEEYLPVFKIRKRCSTGKFNYHLKIDLSDEFMEIKKVIKNTQSFSHSLYDLPENNEWVELLKRKNFDEEFQHQKNDNSSEYEFCYYDENNHKKCIYFKQNEEGPAQTLLNLLKTEYAWIEEMKEF